VAGIPVKDGLLQKCLPQDRLQQECLRKTILKESGNHVAPVCADNAKWRMELQFRISYL
jgi:hypothetical protein